MKHEYVDKLAALFCNKILVTKTLFRGRHFLCSTYLSQTLSRHLSHAPVSDVTEFNDTYCTQNLEIYT